MAQFPLRCSGTGVDDQLLTLRSLFPIPPFDGTNLDDHPSHQQSVGTIYGAIAFLRGTILMAELAVKIYLADIIQSLWIKSTSGNSANFSATQITELQLPRILQIISPCGVYSGLQGDLGSAEILHRLKQDERSENKQDPGLLSTATDRSLNFPMAFTLGFQVRFWIIQQGMLIWVWGLGSIYYPFPIAAQFLLGESPLSHSEQSRWDCKSNVVFVKEERRGLWGYFSQICLLSGLKQPVKRPPTLHVANHVLEL